MYFMNNQLLFPISDGWVAREEKENALQQRARVIWLTGPSGSGKSTLAAFLERKLFAQGFLTQVLDGDNMRVELSPNLGFSTSERVENVRRAAVVAKMFKECGVITICSFISPKRIMRATAREIIGADDFLEVHINTPIDTCIERDVKGLYERVLSENGTDFTGLRSTYEVSENPFVLVDTEHTSIEESGNLLYSKVLPFLINPINR